MDDPNLDRRTDMPSPGEVVICPWCNLECEGVDALKGHVSAQHLDERRKIDLDRIEEIARWHQGKINVIDI